MFITKKENNVAPLKIVLAKNEKGDLRGDLIQILIRYLLISFAFERRKWLKTPIDKNRSKSNQTHMENNLIDLLCSREELRKTIN